MNFMWAQARVGPGVATPLVITNTRVERPYSEVVYSSNEKQKLQPLAEDCMLLSG